MEKRREKKNGEREREQGREKVEGERGERKVVCSDWLKKEGGAHTAFF